ncbi:MAG: glycerol-3-phosphate acyltransferase, partial [bacterium]
FVKKFSVEPVQAQNYLLLLACALLLGNAHSIFLQFKGGKGVATTLGIVAYLIPSSLLLLFVISWVVLLLATKITFVASIGAMALLTMVYGILYFTPNNLLFYFLVVICYWLVLRHKTNIYRFFKG